MPTLTIEIDSTEISPALTALKQALPMYLAPFDLQVGVILNDNPIKLSLPQNQTKFTADSILKNMQPRITLSHNRVAALANGGNYLHVLFASNYYDQTLGVMYDTQQAAYREGCAVFIDRIKAYFPTQAHFQTALLRTTLHEIGHCFDLDHIPDGSVMTQTGDLDSGWINNPSFQYSPKQLTIVKSFWSKHYPGGPKLASVDYDDKGNVRTLRIGLKRFSSKAVSVGDAFSLLVTLKNTGKAALTLPQPLDPLNRNLRILIKVPGKAMRRLRPMLSGCGPDAALLEFAAREEKILPVHLYADAGGYLFSSPGQYRVKIGLRTNGQGWKYSRSLSFTVSENEDQAPELKSAIFSPAVLQYIGLKGTSSPELAERITELINHFPESELARILQWTQSEALQRTLRICKAREKKKIEKKLTQIHQRLLELETSNVKRGRLHAYLSGQKGNKTKGKLHPDQQQQELEAYQAFQEKLIKRTYKI